MGLNMVRTKSKKKKKFDVRDVSKGTQFKKGDPRAGRKPRVIELKAREFILKIIDGDRGLERLVKKIFDQALKGAYKQQELLLNYILGRPVEKIKIDAAYGANTVVAAPVLQIIADTLRLKRLEADAAEVPEAVEENRIEEVERVLEGAITNGKANGTSK